MIDLCPDTIRVINEMAHQDDEHIPYVRDLARDIDMPVEKLRRILRTLMEAGVAGYGPVFDQDTGRPKGSAYWLTDAGAELRRTVVAA